MPPVSATLRTLLAIELRITSIETQILYRNEVETIRMIILLL